MPDFTVNWKLELGAETAAGAAQSALEWMRDEGSDAACFTVTNDETGEEILIDLNDEEYNQAEEQIYINPHCRYCAYVFPTEQHVCPACGLIRPEFIEEED